MFSGLHLHANAFTSWQSFLFCHLNFALLPSAGSSSMLFLSQPSVLSQYCHLICLAKIFRFALPVLSLLSPFCCLPPSPAESFPRRGRRRRPVVTSRNSEKSNNSKRTSRLAGRRASSGSNTTNIKGLGALW